MKLDQVMRLFEVIFLGSLSISLRNRRIHLGYIGHAHAGRCTRRPYTRGFVLVRRREVLATMSSRLEVLSINPALVIQYFLGPSQDRHRLVLRWSAGDRSAIEPHS